MGVIIFRYTGTRKAVAPESFSDSPGRRSSSEGTVFTDGAVCFYRGVMVFVVVFACFDEDERDLSGAENENRHLQV